MLFVLWLLVRVLTRLLVMVASRWRYVYRAVRQARQSSTLQRLSLSGDSVEAVQADELQGTGDASHRNGRASVSVVC